MIVVALIGAVVRTVRVVLDLIAGIGERVVVETVVEQLAVLLRGRSLEWIVVNEGVIDLEVYMKSDYYLWFGTPFVSALNVETVIALALKAT